MCMLKVFQWPGGEEVTMISRARTDRTAIAHVTGTGSFSIGNVYEGGSNRSMGIVRKRRAEVQGKASKRRHMGTYTATRMGALAISVYVQGLIADQKAKGTQV